MKDLSYIEHLDTLELIQEYDFAIALHQAVEKEIRSRTVRMNEEAEAMRRLRETLKPLSY